MRPRFGRRKRAALWGAFLLAAPIRSVHYSPGTAQLRTFAVFFVMAAAVSVDRCWGEPSFARIAVLEGVRRRRC